VISKRGLLVGAAALAAYNALPAQAELAGPRRVLLGAPPFRASYIGQVATGCRVPQLLNSGSATQMMSRSRHRMATSTSTMRVGFPAFWAGLNSGSYVENQVGTNANFSPITASLEYPSGTFTQLTFEGFATGFLGNTNILFSDAVAAPPQGAFFYIRTYRTNANGTPYTYWTNGVDTTNGETCTFGTSGVTDQTMSGTITNTSNGVMYSPLAIIGLTSQPSIGIIGDSRAFGYADTFSGTSGAIGNIERSISGNFALINCGVSGDRADSFIYTCAARMSALRFCSDLICEYPINDIMTGGDTAAAVEHNLQTIWGLWPDPTKVFQCTMEPYTTSTDSWATTANQTTNAHESVRVAVNDWIRTTPVGIKGYFEIANQVETSQDSGKWKVNGTANWYTNDGIHETNAAALAVAASGCIPPGAFNLAAQ